MKIKTLYGSIALSTLFVAIAWSADLAGKWNAEFTTPNGETRQNTFTFQVDGNTLTGTVSTQRGESKIEDGKISGDEITFSVTRNRGGNDIKFHYKGKVNGDEIKFTVTVGEGDRTFEMTAKRAK